MIKSLKDLLDKFSRFTNSLVYDGGICKRLNKINLNYFTTKLSEHINNSNKGGYVKFMGEYDSLEYFTSLIYRNSYEYLGVSVGNSYNFSLGATYNISKNLSLSLKGRNLFDDSTKSLYKEGGIGADFSLEDYQREITFSMKWVF
ncbi:MAG: hypothetical protein C0627_12150 [Sulfurimonas sp.]|nr:MAG: hypothetical protein C0627_12150 [Sulfurimonas sp.]